MMYICPPHEGMYIYNNYNFVPYTMGGFRMYPNYNKKYNTMSKEEKEALSKEEKLEISTIDTQVDNFIL